MSKAEKTQNTEQKQFTRKAALVLPTYSTKDLPVGKSVYLRVDGEILTKLDIDQKTGEQKLDKNGKPAEMHICPVTDLNSGEYGELVLSVVVYNAFRLYPELKGRAFEMKKLAEISGKATKWEIFEIEA